jgi:PAS domain S-box-containing protein
MKRRLSLYYGALLVLLGLALGVVGFGLATTARHSGHAYEQALLDFVDAERIMDAELRKLEIGAGNHFDGLKEAVLAVRRAEVPLSTIPRYLSSAAAFNEARLQLAVMVNERLALVEEFKTGLAALQVSLDALPEKIEAAQQEGIDAGNSGDMLLARAAGNLARLVSHPGGTVDAQLSSELSTLAAEAGEEVNASFKPGLAAFVKQGETIRARNKVLDEILVKLASAPLSGRAVDLVELYEAAEFKHRQRTAYILGGITVVLVLGLAALFFAGLRRAQVRLDGALADQAALKSALKEAKAQSETVKRGEREQSALLAEERHNALVLHAFDLMAILSRQENYIHVSPACEAFFGLTDKEMIGKSVYEGIHADDIIKVQDYLARAQRELPTEQTIQYRVMDAFGKWHLVETFASNQASNPAVRGMVLNTRRLGMAPDSKAR